MCEALRKAWIQRCWRLKTFWANWPRSKGVAEPQGGESTQATAECPQWDTDLGAVGRPPRLWRGAGLEVLVSWELWEVSAQRRNFLKAFLKMTVADSVISPSQSRSSLDVHTIDLPSEIDGTPLTPPPSAHSVFRSVSALRAPNRNPQNPTSLMLLSSCEFLSIHNTHTLSHTHVEWQAHDYVNWLCRT